MQGLAGPESSMLSGVEVGEVGRKPLYCCTHGQSKCFLRGETLEWGKSSFPESSERIGWLCERKTIY